MTINRASKAPHFEPETFFVTRYQSPLGEYVIVSSRRGVVCLLSEEQARLRLARWKGIGIETQDGNEHNHTATGQLDAYFSGRLYRFNVPLDLRGTPFQRQVWEMLQSIPYGETRSYISLASALGRPDAARAVGQANHRNHVAIIIPCHRVIGADGRLTGYAGGLHRKQALLDLETAGLRNRDDRPPP